MFVAVVVSLMCVSQACSGRNIDMSCVTRRISIFGLKFVLLRSSLVHIYHYVKQGWKTLMGD